MPKVARAAHDVVEIDDRNGLADIAALGGRLEAEFQPVDRRHFQPRRHFDDVAESELSTSRLMNNRMIACPAIGRADAPYVCGSALEHQACRGAGDPHRLVELAHAARAIGVLVAVLGAALCLDHFHARPVGLQFVGEHHGQSGANAGAHLRAVCHDRHQSGLVDRDIHIGRKRRGRRRFGDGEAGATRC